MTLKHVAIIGAFIGSGVGGFITARIAKEPAALAAPFSPDKRLESIELKLEVIAADINMAKTDVRVIKCYLHLENICPPDVRP